jgi:peptide/nickel transport system substrate-binding protein
LNPGRLNNGGGGNQYAELAYDPLIYLAPSGKYVPDLATSWGYVGTGNTKFVIHLRSGVQFSDGSTMTAADVVKSIKYDRTGQTTASSYLGGLTSAVASGPLTVTLIFKAAQPDLQTIFDQNEMAGDIIGPKLLGTPKALGTQTDGAGPYMIDASKTVTGSSYVYVPNPHYWNKSLQRFHQFTLKVITTTASALDALRTGGADFMVGDATQASAAQSAGLKVYSAPGGFTPLWITDYQGKLVKALGNPQVRQALAYATDRPALAKAILDGYAVPTDEISSPGYTGYIPGAAWNDYYTYDVAKAKKLLADAGYPHGFTMTVPAFAGQDEEQETEALASEFSTIGVTLKIHEVASFDEWVTAFLSGKYPGGVLEYGTLPASIEASEIFTKTAIFNVFHNPLPSILSLVNRANGLDGAAANTLYQNAMKIWIQQGYADVLFDVDSVSFAKANTVSNIDIGTSYPGSDLSPDLAFWSPAS